MMYRFLGFVMGVGVMVFPQDGTAQSTGLGLTIHQNGDYVPLMEDTSKIDLIRAQMVQLRPAPFEITLDFADCAPDAAGTFVRAVPIDAQMGLLTEVNDAVALDDYAQTMDALFPLGDGYADSAPQTTLFVSDPADPIKQRAYNNFVEDRYFDRNSYVETIAVKDLFGLGDNALANGVPFVMLVGRNHCDDFDDRLLLDIIIVTFDAPLTQ